MLRYGTTKCPTDKIPLEFKGFAGMKLMIDDASPPHYLGRCPTCFNVFEIRARRVKDEKNV